MNMSLGKFWELVIDREVLHAAVHGFAELDITEPLNWPPGWVTDLPSFRLSVGTMKLTTLTRSQGATELFFLRFYFLFFGCGSS